MLRGGPSSEYEVSLKTGASVSSSLPEKYHPLDVFIDRGGTWHLHGRAEEPHSILNKVDVVWNAMHGEYGEDGEVSRLLTALGLPYVGSEHYPSLLAMNKVLAKQIVQQNGIKTPYAKVIRIEDASDISSVAMGIYREFPQPAIIKPALSGSSIGVSVADSPEGIAYALELAFQSSDAVIVEEFIEGTEVVCGVVDGYRGYSLYSLLPMEIKPAPEMRFLDYHGRHSDEVEIRAPRNLSRETKEELQETAKEIHRILGLRHFSTTDFIVHPKHGVFFLETDSLPSLTQNSPFVRGLGAIGSTLEHFIDHTLTLAQARK